MWKTGQLWHIAANMSEREVILRDKTIGFIHD
jgi:hypothetical protein